MNQTPCIIITRDRVNYLRQCLASLSNEPRLDIQIVDHGSTYEPMVEFLKDSPVPVWFCGDRRPRDLWTWEGLRHIVGDGRKYLVTDPDIILDEKCPSDWLDRLDAEMQYDHMVKVGMGIRRDDLPDTDLGRSAAAWESAFWVSRTRSRTAWNAPVDTTLALHPPLSVLGHFRLAPAIRTDSPYLIRHLPWYGDEDNAEATYYRDHLVPGSSHWTER